MTDVAFHDGADVPIQALAFFPVVVLNADRAPPDAVRALAQVGSHPVARLAAQPRNAPDDLLARARRLAVAGYEGALLEIAPGSSAAAGWTPRAVAEAIAALRTIWPQGPLLLAADPHLAVEAAPQLSAVVVSGAVARARGARGIRAPGALDRPHDAAPDRRRRSRSRRDGGSKRAGSPSRLRARGWFPG